MARSPIGDNYSWHVLDVVIQVRRLEMQGLHDAVDVYLCPACESWFDAAVLGEHETRSVWLNLPPAVCKNQET